LSRLLDALLHFVAKEWKLRPCCLRLCFVLLVLLLAFLAVLSWPNNLSQNWKATVQRAERAVGLGAERASDESYNCDVDFRDWKAAWSNTKSFGVGQVGQVEGREVDQVEVTDGNGTQVGGNDQ